MSAQPAIPTRPSLIPLGFIWGALFGLGLTLLATLIPTLLTYLVYPGMDDETRGYLLFIFPGFYCGIIFLPVVLISTLVGFGFALYLNRQPRRVSGGQTMALGIISGLIVFAIAAGGFLYFVTGSVLGAPTTTDDGAIGAVIWLAPPLVLLMAGYTLLASWLNRRLPVA